MRWSQQQFNYLQTCVFLYLLSLKVSISTPTRPMDTSQNTPQYLIHQPSKQICANTQLTSQQIAINIQQPTIQAQCRICLQPEQLNNKLISACKCLGFLQYTHVQCLQQWLLKKYQQSNNKTQFQQHHNSVCQICQQRYTVSYGLVAVWVSWDNFIKKIRINKCTVFANIVFIVANLVCLILGTAFAVREDRSDGSDLKSPKFYIVFFLIILTFCTSAYGIYQFVSAFMIEHIIKIQLPGEAGEQLQAHPIEVKMDKVEVEKVEK